MTYDRQSIFNRDFFPTPPEVIELMLEGLNLQNKKVWEPEGGKGDIVKALQARGAEVIACETNMDLRKILQTICPLIGTDMLLTKSEEISHVDYIVMNPPFSQAAAHITHAYHVAPAGCKIVALCNSETLKNTYSKSREELIGLVDTYGQAQSLGNCFATSERQTDVEVSLIRLDKPGEASKEFDGFFLEDEEEPQENGLMTYSAVRDLVNRYVESIKIFDQQLESAIKLNEMQRDYFSNFTFAVTTTRAGAPLERNRFKKEMQIAGWKWIFNKLDMQKYSTRGLREDINKFVETQQEVPFTMRNIYRMIEIVVGTTSARMDKAIEEVFNKVTDHSHDNRKNLEGWQTNSHYLLNRRFIIPRMVAQDRLPYNLGRWSTGNKIDNAYGSYFDLMEDMNKALCYVTGVPFEAHGTLSSTIRYRFKVRWSDGIEYASEHERANQIKEHKATKGIEANIIDSDPVYGEWFEWGFFKCKAHKKGTMHFEFLDEKVWAEFNRRVAKIKGYPLPENRKQTKWQKQRYSQPEPQPMESARPQEPRVYATI